MTTNNYVSGTFTGNAQSSSLVCHDTAVVFVGGAGGVDFGSGTVTVQFKGPDGQWYNSAETITARDVRLLQLTMPTEVRLDISGSTTPDLDYAIQSDTLSSRD